MWLDKIDCFKIKFKMLIIGSWNLIFSAYRKPWSHHYFWGRLCYLYTKYFKSYLAKLIVRFVSEQDMFQQLNLNHLQKLCCRIASKFSFNVSYLHSLYITLAQIPLIHMCICTQNSWPHFFNFPFFSPLVLDFILLSSASLVFNKMIQTSFNFHCAVF